jgi:MarR family transcriptional regulator, organic hydroperoxide resistance regulator
MQLKAGRATEEGNRHSSRRTGSAPIIRHLLESGSQEESLEPDAVLEHEGYAVTQSDPEDEMTEEDGGIQAEIVQRRPFHSVKAEVAVSILRTAALIERHFAQVVAQSDITVQQYNVLRILRGAGEEGIPTLVIRDRMIHAAPGITRLLDKLESAGLARRERCSPDRRQVLCYITARGLEVLDRLDAAMRQADDQVVGDLEDAEQRQLLKLLERVRAGQRRGQTPIDSALTGHGPATVPTK